MATYYPIDDTLHPPSGTVAADGLVIRHIGFSDLLDALRLGWEDFKAVPSHAIVLCVIYPVIGILLCADGARLLGLADAGSDRRRLCPDRAVCGARTL